MKRGRLRFIILFTVIAIILGMTAVLVAKNGDHFTLKYINTTYGEWAREKEIGYSLDKEGVIKVEKAYLDETDWTICLDCISVGKGKVNVKAWIEADNLGVSNTELVVTDKGFIYEGGLLNFNGYHKVETVVLLCLTLAFAVMAWSFFECWKKADFSYSMVAYGGLALFMAAIVVYTLYYRRTFDHFQHFLYTISETGFYFVLVAAPLMLLLSFLFSFSNIWLVRHEGFRPVNLLGIVLGFVSLVGTVFILFGRYKFFDYNSFLRDGFFVALAYIASFLECVFLFIMITAFLSTRHYPAYNKAYVIVLGCGIRKDGTLTPLLKARVDSALKFEKEQFEKTGKHAKFIPSGGQGPNEVISESEAMKRYMLEQGIPEESILMEDKSNNTWQNIKYSKQVIEKDNGTAEGVKAAFATTNYHIFRGYTLSDEHHLDVEGISAKTKWYFFPNAFLREFAGLLAAKKIQVGIIMMMLFITAGIVHMILV